MRLGRDQAWAVEESGLCGVGLRDAAQADLAVRCGRQDHVMRLDARDLVEDRARRISKACPALPHLEALPQEARKQTRIWA
jgi:hypothetical protein